MNNVKGEVMMPYETDATIMKWYFKLCNEEMTGCCAFQALCVNDGGMNACSSKLKLMRWMILTC